jgi:hypothetical protein
MVRSSSSHLRLAGAELKDSARHVWLAGIGALSKAKDGGGRLFDSLVQTGREVEAHTVPMLNGLRQQAEELLAGVRRAVTRGPAKKTGARKRAAAPSGGTAKRKSASSRRKAPAAASRKPAARTRKAAVSTAPRGRKAPNRGKPKSARKSS